MKSVGTKYPWMDFEVVSYICDVNFRTVTIKTELEGRVLFIYLFIKIKKFILILIYK